MMQFKTLSSGVLLRYSSIGPCHTAQARLAQPSWGSGAVDGTDRLGCYERLVVHRSRKIPVTSDPGTPLAKRYWYGSYADSHDIAYSMCQCMKLQLSS